MPKSITINEDQFFEVVKKANDEFMAIGAETKPSDLTTMLMGLQNMAFGSLIAKVMFVADKDDE